MKQLGKEFFQRENVVTISRELIGKYLITVFDGGLTSGIIIETEAYNGVVDKASHAFGGRRTKRNEIMYGEAGNSYVYLCYGIHHLFNIVTNKVDVPQAVLIRAIIPMDGSDVILKRRKQAAVTNKTADGPGTMSQALGIRTSHTGIPLLKKNGIWVEDRGVVFSKKDIEIGPRIGVDYAGEDAKLPYRFRVNNNTVKKILHEQYSKSNFRSR